MEDSNVDETIITQNIYEVPIWEIIFAQGISCVLQGAEGHSYLSEGGNKTEARLSLTKDPSFWKNYSKLSREERKNLRPFRLRRKGKIEKILDCEKRYKNKREEYTCGKPINEDEGDNGENGMCCIMGYDIPLYECPYNPSGEE